MRLCFGAFLAVGGKKLQMLTGQAVKYCIGSEKQTYTGDTVVWRGGGGKMMCYALSLLSTKWGCVHAELCETLPGGA